MYILNSQAKITCDHRTGVANLLLPRFQGFVTIQGAPVLRRNDPEFELISGCPNVGPTIKPCTSTLIADTGYSSLVFIEGIPVCLDTISGLTDGTPPGIVQYHVRNPGQSFVSEV